MATPQEPSSALLDLKPGARTTDLGVMGLVMNQTAVRPPAGMRGTEIMGMNLAPSNARTSSRSRETRTTDIDAATARVMIQSAVATPAPPSTLQLAPTVSKAVAATPSAQESSVQRASAVLSGAQRGRMLEILAQATVSLLPLKGVMTMRSVAATKSAAAKML